MAVMSGANIQQFPSLSSLNAKNYRQQTRFLENIFLCLEEIYFEQKKNEIRKLTLKTHSDENNVLNMFFWHVSHEGLILRK